MQEAGGASSSVQEWPSEEVQQTREKTPERSRAKRKELPEDLPEPIVKELLTPTRRNTKGRLEDHCVELQEFDLVSRSIRKRPQDTPFRRRKTLRREETAADDDYQDLCRMNTMFNSECTTGAGFVVGSTTFREMWTWFLVREDQKIGYMSVTPAYEHLMEPCKRQLDLFLSSGKTEEISQRMRNLPATLPMLTQIWVDPQHRKKGIATEALGV